MELFKRLKEPTPKFFIRLRNIGIGLTAIGGAIVTLPVLMPAVLSTIAGYLIVAGTVASVVSQTAINDGKDNEDDGSLPTDGNVIPLWKNPLLDPNR